MTTASERAEIRDLIEQIDRTYWGPEERAMIDKALDLAQEIGDEELEYQVRMRLTASGSRTGDNDAMLTSFTWCLAKYDQNPSRFPSGESDQMADLMWQFKWIIGALDASSIFTLAQCEAMLDDMEAHYRRANLGMSGVITSRFQHAWETGKLDEAKQLRTLLETTPRDDHSHCDACGRSELAGFAAEIGEEELALKLVDEIVEGGFTCGEEPEGALAKTLIPMLRAGRTEDALDSHLRSYRLARDNPDNITIVADNMVFCAVTGNEARGLAMVERHLPWVAHDGLNEAGQVHMLTAVCLVLAAVVNAGHGDQVVRGADAASLTRFFGGHEGVWTAAELARVAWKAVLGLAGRFDARNSNSYVSDKAKHTMDLLGEHWDVPMRTEVFLPATPLVREPNTPTEWLTRTELCVFANLPRDAVEAGNAMLNSTAEDGSGATPAQVARALQLIIASLIQLDQAQDLAGLLEQRETALRADGRGAQADLEKRAGMALFGAPTDEDMMTLAEEIERLEATPGAELADVELTVAAGLLQRAASSDESQAPAADAAERALDLLTRAVNHAASYPTLQVSALLGLSHARAQLGGLEAALEPVTRALDLSRDLPGLRPGLLRHRASIYGGLSRFQEGAVDADEAVTLLLRHGLPTAAIGANALAADLHQDAGAPEEAVLRLRHALREAEQSQMPTLGLRYRLGVSLTSADQPLEAVEYLWQVLSEETEAETTPADKAATAMALGSAFEGADKPGNAARVYQDGADWLEEADEPAQAAEALRRKGNILRRFDMGDEAVETLNHAWELIRDTNERVRSVAVLEALALAKGENDDPTSLEDIDRCIELVATDPDGPYTWKLADLADSKARILMQLENWSEAAACFLTASDGYAESADWSSAIGARHMAAQLLAGPGERASEAIMIWETDLKLADQATAAGEDVSELRGSILVKLADALDAQGRPSEAAQARAAAAAM